MTTCKYALTLATAFVLSACAGPTTNNTSTPTAGATVCSTSAMVMNTIDINQPTLQLWSDVLRSVAAGSNFTIPSLPGVSEDTKTYYQMGLLALDTTLSLNGCPSSKLKEIMAKEI